jgi:hypothetical protein
VKFFSNDTGELHIISLRKKKYKERLVGQLPDPSLKSTNSNSTTHPDLTVKDKRPDE